MRAPNTSSAVMAQRVEASDSRDFFPTPPWATRALGEWLAERCNHLRSVWEPACGAGDMARPLSEFFDHVVATDVYPVGFGATRDFLWPGDDPTVDWVITNPPFRLASQFIARALDVAQVGVAVLVRTAFLESRERFDDLFSRTPPSDVLQFVERVAMFRNRLERDGASATAYCWLVWRYVKSRAPLTELHWLAPCRKRLEKDADYGAAP